MNEAFHSPEAFVCMVLDTYGVLSQLQFCYPNYLGPVYKNGPKYTQKKHIMSEYSRVKQSKVRVWIPHAYARVRKIVLIRSPVMTLT